MILTFGKHKGKPIGDVPMAYLAWLLEEGFLHAEDRNQIVADLARRLGLPVEPEIQYVHANAIDNETMDLFNRAYRKAALLCHPDRGGDTETMQLLNELRDRFRNL